MREMILEKGEQVMVSDARTYVQMDIASYLVAIATENISFCQVRKLPVS